MVSPGPSQEGARDHLGKLWRLLGSDTGLGCVRYFHAGSRRSPSEENRQYASPRPSPVGPQAPHLKPYIVD
jgi:hypothetical protein